MSNACTCSRMWICAWMLCTPLFAVTICVSDCCGTQRRWKREKEKAVGEKRRGKLKLHDEYIRAQGPGWEQQSKHRFAVSKQTVRGRRDFPIETARDALYLNTHEYTQYSMSLCYSRNHYKTQTETTAFSVRTRIKRLMSTHTQRQPEIANRNVKFTSTYSQHNVLPGLHSVCGETGSESCGASNSVCYHCQIALMHIAFNWGNTKEEKKEQTSVLR